MYKKFAVVTFAFLLIGILIYTQLHKKGGNSTEKEKEVFTIVVDYSRNLTDSIEAGSYNWVNKDISEENFPTSKNEVAKKELRSTLYHFNKSVVFYYAIAQMEKDGKRPATLKELLAFGETYPKLQMEFKIVAFGSVWVDHDGNRSVACLDSSPRSGRDLDWDWYDDSYDNDCRFLAVEK